jgi:hypothetical protein
MIEHELQKDELNPYPWYDIRCGTCYSVIATIQIVPHLLRTGEFGWCSPRIQLPLSPGGLLSVLQFGQLDFDAPKLLVDLLNPLRLYLRRNLEVLREKQTLYSQAFGGTDQTIRLNGTLNALP